MTTSLGNKVLVAFAVTLFCGRSVNAQTNERAYESLELRAVTPGARAVAMGKTFVGIADDATAAASNPAGLSNLLDPQASIEWTSANYRHRRVVNTDAHPPTKTFSQTVGFPSFVSVVLPLPPSHRLGSWTLAGFYNSLQRYAEHYVIPNYDDAGHMNPQGGYFGDMDIAADAFGFSAAVLALPWVSVGGAVTVQHLRFDVDSNTSSTDRPGEVRFRSGTVTLDTDATISGQAGVLVKPTARLTAGVSYLRGSTFHLDTNIRGEFTDYPDGRTARTRRVEDIFGESPVMRPIDYRLPDRVVAGLSFRWREAFTFVGDIGWIKYSQRVTPHFLIVDFLAQAKDAGLTSTLYRFDDVKEMHGGVEYRLLRGSKVVAVRGGVFTDPDHQMRFNYEVAPKNVVTEGQHIQFDLFDPGKGVGVTGGGGVVLKNRFQIDGAMSWSAYGREVVVSSVVRFPR